MTACLMAGGIFVVGVFVGALVMWMVKSYEADGGKPGGDQEDDGGYGAGDPE